MYWATANDPSSGRSAESRSMIRLRCALSCIRDGDPPSQDMHYALEAGSEMMQRHTPVEADAGLWRDTA